MADHPRGIVLLLRRAVLGLALLFAGLYLAVALLRIAYPFELEWMEGACVDHVRRILAGQKLYVAPSLDFVPFVYPPLYFYLAAALTKLTGVGFFPLRLLSFASSLGCFALIFLIAKRQTHSTFAGIVGIGLFAACYRVAGAWYDVARVDTVCLLFVLAAIYLIQLDRGWPSHLLAGVFVALAFLTKQAGLVVALPLMVFAVAFQRRPGLVFASAGLLLSAAATLVLDRVHGGWYWYYLFELPAEHKIDAAAALGFWTTDTVAAVPVALLGAALFLTREFKHDRRGFFFWGAVSLGAIGASWSGRAHSGGYNNVLIPGYAALSITLALALNREVTAAQARRPMLLALVYLLCIAQFLRLAYDPRRQLPTAADRGAGEELIAAMRTIKGDVYMPYHGYLPTLAGKRCYAHAMAVWDVARGRDEKAKERLIGEIIGAIHQRRFAGVIVDSDVFGQPDLDTYYSRYPIQFSDDVFYPITGMRTRPKYLYLPRRDTLYPPTPAPAE